MVLSAVTVLPAASWIVAVRTRVAPEVRLVVAPRERDLGGGAVDDGEGAERAGGEAGCGRFHRDRADERAGDRLRGDAARGGRGAGAGDGAGADCLAKVIDGGAVGGDGVAGGVLDRRGEDAGCAGGEVGGGAGERDVGGGAVDDGEGAEGAGGEAGGGGFHRRRSRRAAPVIVFGRDAGGGRGGAGAGDGAAPDCLAEGDDGGVVGGDGVAGRVLDVAVRTRVAPEVRLAVAPVSAICAAAPWTTVKEPSVPVVRPAGGGLHATGPTRAPVIVLVATPAAAVAVPVPVTVPAPDCLAKVTTVVLSAVTVLPAASWIVAVEDPRRAGGEVGRRAGERDLRRRRRGRR